MLDKHSGRQFTRPVLVFTSTILWQVSNFSRDNTSGTGYRRSRTRIWFCRIERSAISLWEVRIWTGLLKTEWIGHSIPVLPDFLIYLLYIFFLLIAMKSLCTVDSKIIRALEIILAIILWLYCQFLSSQTYYKQYKV